MADTATRDPDDLDDTLHAAYEARAAAVQGRAPGVDDVRRRVRRNRRRRRAGAVGLAAVAAVAVLAVVVARPPGSTSLDAVAPVPSVWAPPVAAAPLDIGQTSARWYGPPTTASGWAYLAGAEVLAPSRQPGATFVAELRVGDDWRRTPAVSAVAVEQAYDDVEVRGAAPVASSTGRRMKLARYGEERASLVVEIDQRRVVRLSGRGVSSDAVQSLGDSVQLSSAGLTWPALPDGLQVVTSSPVDRTAHRRSVLTFERADGNADPTRLRVVARDDPVAIVEDPVQLPLHPTVDVVVGGHAAALAESGPARADVTWRDGGTVFTASIEASPGTNPGGPTFVTTDQVRGWLAEIVPIPAGELATMVLPTVELPVAEASVVPYPVDSDAQAVIDGFRAAVPAPFHPFTADPPTDAGDGITTRLRDDVDDQWIDLSFVHSTTGSTPAATGAPVVVEDRGWSRQVQWRSPSGWTYRIAASSKSGPSAPMTVSQMADLLRSLDQR